MVGSAANWATTCGGGGSIDGGKTDSASVPETSSGGTDVDVDASFG